MLAITGPGAKRPAAEPLPGRHRQPAHTAPARLRRHEAKLTGPSDIAHAEATTSWSFAGPGLRLSCELLGPEYSMSWNTLDTEVKLFLSRETHAVVGEELVEKQNTDVGLLPLVADESHHYGYQKRTGT